MRKYLEKLKEIETGNYFDKSPGTKVPKVSKGTSGTFDTSTQAQIEKKSNIHFNADKEKNISLSRIQQVPKVPEVPFDTFDTAIQAENQKNIALIRSWLFKIEEPEEFHYLVIDKCKQDPEAFKYFLNWANRDNG